MLQALTGPTRNGSVTSPVRARATTVRGYLLTVPARLVRHARTLTPRLPPGPYQLPAVLARLQALPAPT